MRETVGGGGEVVFCSLQFCAKSLAWISNENFESPPHLFFCLFLTPVSILYLFLSRCCFPQTPHETPSFCRELLQEHVLSTVALGDSIRNAPSVFEIKHTSSSVKESPSSPLSQPIISPPLPKEQLYSAVIKYLIKHETSVPVFSSPAQASPWPSPPPQPLFALHGSPSC